ncbi:MAG TPA: alkaline phosphatase D family protein [Thermoleophilaceae bacterium]|nr:alkaline phosphatase D family protein [Thermoleophilaceae bacterium]
MPDLVLGPLLRHVGENCAVVWVETDSACEVGVLGSHSNTFTVAGHHYAIVRAEGLESGTPYEYEVELDGKRVWPLDDSPFPPSRFQTQPIERPLKIAFGSCRAGMPNEPPFTLTKDEDERGHEYDALRALALQMTKEEPTDWPDLLMLLGDQVYADEVSPKTREFVAGRRDIDGEPGAIALDYEEYTRLYHEAWSEPVIRWLLSTVSSAMIFDDHDVHDDWNTSAAWVEAARKCEWWEEHEVGALMSYWVYQHAGNLSPDEQDRDGMLARVHQAGDAEDLLRDYAKHAAETTDGTCWSYYRDLGAGTRLVVIDSRAGRCLEEGARSMLDPEEWEWVEEKMTGDVDHLLIATSLPWLLSPGMHYIEAWSEAVCGGAWGSLAARVGERLRRAIDLEHWAAFNESFDRLAEIQRAVGAGERGDPPATIVTLSGDVHHAYLSEVGYPREAGVRSAVYQAVCSPLRNPLDKKERRVIKAASSKAAHAIARGFARAAGVHDPPVRWRNVDGAPWFDNQVGTISIEDRRMDMTLDKAVAGDEPTAPRLDRVLERRLA